MITRLINWLAIGVLTIPALVSSLELPDSLQFHGFASQGYNWTSDNNFFGSSTGNGSFDFTELGLNSSWLPVSYLQFSGQVVLRRAGDTDESNLRLDYGLADYTIMSDETQRWGVRLGRVKNASGFYNETRDVAFTRPSILLPQSIYPDNVRSLALSSDGIYSYGEQRSDYGDLFLQAAAGYPQAVDRELEPLLFGRKTLGSFDGDLSYIARLLYDWNGGRFRAAITYFQSNLDYDSRGSFPTDVPSGSIRIEPWILSLQYNTEQWSLTGEYSLRKVRSQGFGQPTNTATQQAYYLQATYRFLEKWEALLRYDVHYVNQKDKSGEKFAASDPLGRPAYSQFAKDWTIGVGWYVTPAFALRTEYHRIDGTSWLPSLNNPIPSDTTQRWNLFLFLASYRF